MGSLGMQEIIVIFVIALIVFGPRKLPEIGKSIGRGLQEFKKASNDLKRTWEEEVQLEKEKESVSSIFKDTSAELRAATGEIAKDASAELHAATDELAKDTSAEFKAAADEISRDTSEITKEIQ